METIQSKQGTYVKSIPTPLYRWMTNVPYSFILVFVLGTIRSVLDSNWGLQMISQFLGGVGVVYFILAYTNHFVIPQIQVWNQLDATTIHASVSSWIVVFFFLFLFIWNGLLSSSQDFLIHSCVAFLFSSAFHTPTQT